MMRSTIIMLLLLAAGGVSLPTFARATAAAEGEVFPFAAGSEFTWQLPSGEYFIIVAAGDQEVELDVSRMGSAFAQPHERIIPGGTSGTQVIFEDGDTRTLRILRGSGALTLARQDLQRDMPIGGPPRWMETTGALGKGECHSFNYGLSRMDHQALVQMIGKDAEFVIRTFHLDEIVRGMDQVEALGDPNKESSLVLQACARGEAATYKINATYPAPDAALILPPARAIPTPAALTALACCLIARVLMRR